MLSKLAVVPSLLATAIGVLSSQPSPNAPTQQPVQATPGPNSTASASPLLLSGFVRSYYFTRQNASNNPGVQSVYQGNPAKPAYNSNAVNQASWNTGVSLHGAYDFRGSGLFVGATYLYANPLDGPCVDASSHTSAGAEAAHLSPACTRQVPPATNPDDTLPGFALSTFYEIYAGYRNTNFFVKLGDQLFSSPWANPSDGRIKPAAFQGGDATFSVSKYWSLEAADMLQYENRTSSTFNSSTLLTSYSAGAPGLPSNLAAQKCYSTQCTGIDTGGFFYAKAGYANASAGFSANGYFYGISDLVNIWWMDATLQNANARAKPFVAVQAGTDNNAGTSYLGKVDSQVVGVLVGASVSPRVALTLGADLIPQKSDAIVLPKGVSCNSSGPTPTYQIKTSAGSSLQYFLPTNAAQCSNNPNGTTTIYYGGWASPYTDSYAMADPLFTSGLSQGMVERRSGGSSVKAVATYTSANKRFVLIASDAWFDYSNPGAPNRSVEWDLDGTYRFSAYRGSGVYRGFSIRDRYMNRTDANTYYATGTVPACTVTAPCSQLGGVPLFKYNRLMLEYDF